MSEDADVRAIEAAFRELGWNMTPVHMLQARIERLERALTNISEISGNHKAAQMFARHALASDEVGNA